VAGWVLPAAGWLAGSAPAAASQSSTSQPNRTGRIALEGKSTSIQFPKKFTITSLHDRDSPISAYLLVPLETSTQLRLAIGSAIDGSSSAVTLGCACSWSHPVCRLHSRATTQLDCWGLQSAD
jgi:hypothetical protein